jgi:hypothetical protein
MKKRLTFMVIALAFTFALITSCGTSTPAPESTDTTATLAADTLVIDSTTVDTSLVK